MAEENDRFNADSPIWNYCLYCGEVVEAPALYCCEEHAEGRRMEGSMGW